MIRIHELKDKRNFTKNFPKDPGVYNFVDKNSNSIYIGKAKSLEKRLGSYFSEGATKSHKVTNLLLEANSLELIITQTELESLLLEQHLIKEKKPKYNVQFKDDKGYPWIKIETSKEYPSVRLFLGKKNKGDLYFGPFPSSYTVRGALNLIQKSFKLRDCSESFFKNRSRPCLQYEINKCSAPCVKKITKKDYLKEVKNVKSLLSGGSEELIAEFYKEMDKNTQNKTYERAAIYRDKISALREVQRSQSIAGFSKERDAITICSNSKTTKIGLTQVRGGWITSHKNFIVNGLGTDEEIISSFLLNYYFDKKGKPVDIVIQENLSDKISIESFLSNFHKQKIKIISKPTKKDLGLLAISKSNTEFSLKRGKGKSIKNMHRSFSALRDFLESKKEIEIIDSIDISHHSGGYAVGGVVVFNNLGRVDEECRSYNISQKNSGNDISSIEEVLDRRYASLSSSKKSLANLLVIDGGRTHLKVARSKLDKMGLQKIEVISISKGVRRKPEYDKVHTLNLGSKELEKNNLSSHLLQEIRDETHRFSIYRHRRKHSKKFSESSLDNIIGLGKKRKRLLLRFFGSLEQIKKANAQDLAKVPGIGRETSNLVYNYFH